MRASAIMIAVFLIVGGVVASRLQPSASPAASSIVASGPRPCSWLDLQQIDTNLKPSLTKFSDEYQIAKAAPRISLAPLLTQMQDTRRQYEAQSYPSCYATVRTDSLNGMNDTITGFTDFMGQQNDTIVSADFQRANQEISSAVTELARLSP